jgi:hypothetical protein
MMSALSLQFKFALGTGTTTATSVAIPSTSYSSKGDKNFTSQREKGDGYYGGTDGFHTASYTVTPNFSGTLTIQATLATDPIEGDWFNVVDSSVSYRTPILPSTTTTTYVNFTGNFVWVRALVQYNPDSIESGVRWINYNH